MGALLGAVVNLRIEALLTDGQIPAQIARMLGRYRSTPIYLCDPHSPWQRGSNENTNGRHRERFGWKTPAEMLDKLLSDPNLFVAATA